MTSEYGLHNHIRGASTRVVWEHAFQFRSMADYQGTSPTESNGLLNTSYLAAVLSVL